MKTTDYMDGFEYKNNTIERIHHAEGVITQRALRTGESTEFVGAGGLVWQYEYTLKDHLGNTRVTFADIDGSRTIEPNTEISQINHYYPFGLNMEGNWNGASADAKNKYQYNGKELQSDFGLDWNDYGARMYDAAIGRWNAVDPLAIKYNYVNPYCYVGNRPIIIIDPDGMQWATAADEQKAASIRAQMNDKIVQVLNKSIELAETMINTETGSKEYNDAASEKEDLEARSEEIQTARKELDEMGTDPMTFTFKESASGNRGSTIFIQGKNEVGVNKGQNVLQVMMTSPSDIGLVMHELKHAYQMMKGFITSAATTEDPLKMNYGTGGYDSFLLTEEEAYKRQYAYDKSTMPESDSVKPNSIKEVNQKYIQGINQPSFDGKEKIYIYSKSYYDAH